MISAEQMARISQPFAICFDTDPVAPTCDQKIFIQTALLRHQNRPRQGYV